MIIEDSMVRKLVIHGLPNLDPITVYLTNHEFGKGEVVITCWVKSWTAYWGAMGSKLEDFLLRMSTEYLIGKLAPDVLHHIDDIPAFLALVKAQTDDMDFCEDADEDNWREYRDTYQVVLGDCWSDHIPSRINPDYTYIEKVVNVVKQALEQVS